MKKLLLAIGLVGLLSTNAMAWWTQPSTVNTINLLEDGTVKVILVSASATVNNKPLSEVNAEAKKMMLAALLTAQSSGQLVVVYISAGIITQVSLR